ncbi:MAG: DUF4276 family protein [Azoarcus sp.]|jgi:hypothetical protein|nr:DUF4276 family protein [Azoarcus sp.]
MIRVHIVCEGQTEEMFVSWVLADAFRVQGIYLVPSLLGKPGHKGGNVRFERVLADVQKRLLGDRKAWCTTFFDFYGLPEEFPGKAEAKVRHDVDQKAECLQQAMTARLRSKIGDDAMRRFIPYVQMYEFEGLLFSCPDRLAAGIGQSDLGTEFQRIRDGFDTPEAINDSPVTAPSKRILKLFSGYEKPLYGSLAAMEIGLVAIRRECPRFDAWLQQIEALQSP